MVSNDPPQIRLTNACCSALGKEKSHLWHGHGMSHFLTPFQRITQVPNTLIPHWPMTRQHPIYNKVLKNSFFISPPTSPYILPTSLSFVAHICDCLIAWTKLRQRAEPMADDHQKSCGRCDGEYEICMNQEIGKTVWTFLTHHGAIFDIDDGLEHMGVIETAKTQWKLKIVSISITKIVEW